MTDARPPPIFVGDARALDFLNSIATPMDTPIEWLSSGADLLEWLATAKLVAPEVLTSMRRTALPGELDAVAGQARALREWFRGFVKQYKGKPLKPEALKDLVPLNRVLERDQAFAQIVKRDPVRDEPARSGVALRQIRRWQTPRYLAAPGSRNHGRIGLPGGFFQYQSLRRAGLHPAVPRSLAHARPTLV